MDERIEDLLSRKADGELASDEERELAAWTRESRGHEALLKEYLRVRRWMESGREYVPDVWRRFAEWQRLRRRRRMTAWVRYAAVFVVALACGWGIWQYERFERGKEADMFLGEVEQPESMGAFFEWADGRRVVLEEGMRDSVLEMRAGATVRVDENQVLRYETTEERCDSVVRYNRLVVPVGGEYRMALADGTVVWLNSASELEIPTFFQGGERRVRLAGEAYFEVARDESRPFRVEAQGVTVEVLGTKFNVTAYPDEENTATTLVEGRVRLTNLAGKEVELNPGEQAVALGKEIRVGKVNVENVISWMTGRYYFYQARLEEIFRQAERWYGVRVRFEEEELKDIRFSGGVLKFNPVEDLLKMVEATGPVRFRVDGKNILVMRK